MGKVCFFLTSLVSEHLPLLFFRFEFSSSVPSDAERAFGFGFLAVSSDRNNREDHDDFVDGVDYDDRYHFGFGFLAVSSDRNNREDHDDFVDGVDYDDRNHFGFGFLAASSVQRLTINSQHIFFSSKIQTLQKFSFAVFIENQPGYAFGSIRTSKKSMPICESTYY